jgi:hypothetical protein
VKLAFVTAALLIACAHPPSMTAASMPLPAELQSLLPALRADAARRSGSAAERIDVIALDDVTWPDGGLGCAAPGHMVTMALVPGWRLVLGAAGGAPQHYHLSRRGGWVWCAAERSRLPPSGGAQRY